MTYTFSDVIGFGGGFALGMTQAGFELRAKREIMNFGVKNCEANRPLLGWKWDAQVKPLTREPEWDITHTDVVTGNPPCSGFSTLTNDKYRGENAAINDCMWAFKSYVAKAKPTIAAFESVQHAFGKGRGLMQQLRATLEEETGLKYELHHVMHNSLSCGGPANRPRYFWLVSQIPFGVEYPIPDLIPSAMDVLGDLQGLNLTWEKQPYRYPETWWSSRRRSDDGAVDGHIGKNLTHAKRIHALLDALDGEWPEGWREEDAVRKIYERDGRLPDIWKSQEERLVKRDFDMGFNQLQRWYGSKPARVITGAGLSQAMHPTENRLFTNRECARIQGFPDTWRLWPMREYKSLGKTWGKGIPVDAGRWLGYWIKNSLDGNPGSMQGVPIGDREHLIKADKGFKRTQARGGRRKHDFWAA